MHINAECRFCRHVTQTKVQFAAPHTGVPVAAVYLTNWEPPYINYTAAPRQLEAYSAERAAAVRRLKAAAPTALRWYGIANEMDMKLPWFPSLRPGASYCALFGRTPQGWRPHPAVPGEQNGTAIYEAYLRSAHRAFAAAGVDVGMLATDQGLGWHTFVIYLYL